MAAIRHPVQRDEGGPASDAADPSRHIRLDLPAPSDGKERNAVRNHLSAVAGAGRTLWVTGDEGAGLECLASTDGRTWSWQGSFDLIAPLGLPKRSGKRREIDIEGLDVDGGLLWVVGSHAVTRDKPGLPDNDPDMAIELLGETSVGKNRQLLGCVPLVETKPGGFELRADVKGKDGRRHAARLAIDAGEGALVTAIRKAEDPHLLPFLSLPAKENGFDVEGIAVRGGRAFLGLRGPVLGGFAVLLEVFLDVEGDRLRLVKVASGGRRYRKHFLAMEGCGIRDLCFRGDDLLLLVGPTMRADGPVAVWCWRDALDETADSIFEPGHRLVRLLDVPHRPGADRAEGLALVPQGDGREVIVVYDSPHAGRCHGSGAVDADVFLLP